MGTPSTYQISAVSDTLVVDLEAGQKAAVTTIDYQKTPDWVLFHRLDADDWMKVRLLVTDQTDPAYTRGSFSSLPIAPGHSYQAVAVPPGYRPDPAVQPHEWLVSYETSEGPPPFVTVIALRKRPEPRAFLTDGNTRTYGTYHERDISTDHPVLAHYSIGLSAPNTYGDGRMSLSNPADVRVRGPLTGFSFELEPLVPGTDYYTLLLLVDEFGNWQYVADTVTTQQRVVDVTIDAVFVIDDGDDLSEGEAGFDWQLHTGGGPESNIVHYDNKNLDSGTFASPPPTGTLTLGPYTPIPGQPRVFLGVTSEQDNSGSLEGNDMAIGEREIECPAGPGETVQPTKAALQVRDTVSDKYEIRTDYTYKISYL